MAWVALKKKMASCCGIGIVLAVLVSSALDAEVSLRLFSPSYGFMQANFQASNGDKYSLSESMVEGDLVGLEWRADSFPWVGVGSSVFVRYDDIQLTNTRISSSASGAQYFYQSASYSLTTAAPALQVLIYPLPDLDSLRPFFEARVEVYEFADSGLADPNFDRFRLTFAVGVKGVPNATGYFWGARIFAAKRGYSGQFDDIAVPDPVIIGLQVDWIGLDL